MIEELKSTLARSDPREYALIRRRGQPDDPSKIKSYDRRKSPHEVEIEEDLPVGSYYLQEIKPNGDFGEQLWSETLFGSESELEAVKERAREAEQRAEEAKAQAQSESQQSSLAGQFDDPNDALRFEIRRGILENETLMEAYGDRVIEWAFSGDEPGVDYEIENEWQAWLRDVRKNPEQAEAQVELAAGVVRRMGRAGVQGIFEGIEADGVEVEESSTEAATGDAESEREPPDRALTGFDDLAPDEADLQRAVASDTDDETTEDASTAEDPAQETLETGVDAEEVEGDKRNTDDFADDIAEEF
ncbi:MAG: hypothetical protein ABEH77_01400 [Halobacteriaceae archaeon]